MSQDVQLEREVAAEIERFHDFLAAWFRGEVARDDEAFDARLSACWPAGMLNIQPSGIAHAGSEILEKIRGGHGSNPEFRIAIHDVRILDVDRRDGRERVVATYVERQRGARQSTPPANARRSSLWLERAAPGAEWRWLHLHETAVRD